MKIYKGLDFLKENEEWIKSMNPLRITLDCTSMMVDIQASSEADATKEFFRNNISEIHSEEHKIPGYEMYEKYYCEIKKDGYKVCTFFTLEELEELV